jgi:hypothetical protein
MSDKKRTGLDKKKEKEIGKEKLFTGRVFTI